MREEELLRADGALLILSEFVTSGWKQGSGKMKREGEGGVRHMHLIYVATQMEVEVVSGE